MDRMATFHSYHICRIIFHAAVASVDMELFYLERSGHVASVDYDGPALARAAADFIARRC